jgi:hypothetical protein
MLDPVTPYGACCGDFYSSRDERALRGQGAMGSTLP